MTAESIENGEIFLIDKPLEWTSFDVVNKIRNLVKKETQLKNVKIGHAGTLDPLASGLLILCTGKKTKEINQFQGLTKIYEGSFFLGATTPSYDRETEIDAKFPTEGITVEKIHAAAQSMIGEQMQTPPLYSARRINGKRAYKLARKGSDEQLDATSIIIYEFEITGIEMPNIFFRIKCSKGTYIRSIANDFGKKLNSGAYLTSLRRTSIGKYTVEQAQTIEEFEKDLNFVTEEKLFPLGI